MQYIILDLEWNNAYCRKANGFFNEIIEIGAVKLDEKLNIIDEFSKIIKARFGKKLRKSVKELTNITNDDIMHGIQFSKAVSLFNNWIGNDDEAVILTWGNCDIRVLLDNFYYLNGIKTIPFLKNYVDLQKYFQAVIPSETKDQIGLSTAAEKLNISGDKYSAHRALDDSKLSADCFIKIYNNEKFDSMIIPCNDEFYARLKYKAKYITSFNDPLFDKSELKYVCETCGNIPKQLSEWKVVNQSFRAFFYCKRCDKKTRVSVRFKKNFDHVDIRKSITLIKKEAENE